MNDRTILARLNALCDKHRIGRVPGGIRISKLGELETLTGQKTGGTERQPWEEGLRKISVAYKTISSDTTLQPAERDEFRSYLLQSRRALKKLRHLELSGESIELKAGAQLGQFLRGKREGNWGMTLGEVAKKLRMDERKYQEIESGTTVRPAAEVLKKIAKTFGLDLPQLQSLAQMDFASLPPQEQRMQSLRQQRKLGRAS